jgi:hypothetical protein
MTDPDNTSAAQSVILGSVPAPLLEIIKAGSNGKINWDFYANLSADH